MGAARFIINAYLVQIILVIALILFSWFIYDKRFKEKHGREVPRNFEQTDEVFIDPTTGKKMRVYYNPENGERYYREEH